MSAVTLLRSFFLCCMYRWIGDSHSGLHHETEVSTVRHHRARLRSAGPAAQTRGVDS